MQLLTASFLEEDVDALDELFLDEDVSSLDKDSLLDEDRALEEDFTLDDDVALDELERLLELLLLRYSSSYRPQSSSISSTISLMSVSL